MRTITLKCEECGASFKGTNLTPEQAFRLSEDFWDADCKFKHIITLKEADDDH